MSAPAYEAFASVVSAWGWRMLTRLNPSGGQAPDIRLRIGTGWHAGSETVLTGGTGSLGADAGDDVMLVDEEAEGPSVKLSATRSIVGTLLRVDSSRDDLLIAGGPLRDGVSWARLPCALALGPVEIEVSDPGAAPETPLVPGGSITLAVLAVLIVGYLMAPGPAPEVRIDALVAAGKAAPDRAEGDAMAELAARIDAAGLAAHLSVGGGPDGAILVTGSVPASLRGAWRELRMAFDAEGIGAQIVARIRTARDLDRLPAIAAISFGTDPYVQTDDGRVLRPGSALEDGWVISEIGRHDITLHRNGERVSLSF